MPFKITIEETKTVVERNAREYAQVDTEEVFREDKFRLGDDEPKTRVKPVFGWTPTTEKTKSVKRDVLVQEVDELDLHAVIKAINGISN